MKKDGNKLKIFSKDVDQISGLLDKGCGFEGRLTFDGVVQINGNFEGDILSDGTLIVGPEANVKAKITVGTLVLDGKIEGTAEAQNKIEIHANAQFLGDVITPNIIIEEGGVLNGNCHMQPTNNNHLHLNNKTDENEIFIQPENESMPM